jgi:hypothetical protein
VTEFKFDLEHLDDQAIRIVQKLAPLLADEHSAHVIAALTLMVASFITILSSEAGASTAETDAMADKMAKKIKHMVRLQRANYNQFSTFGNA